MQPAEHWLKRTSVPAGDGGGGWNLEMWYGEGGSVEEKQSYLSRKPFLLLK